MPFANLLNLIFTGSFSLYLGNERVTKYKEKETINQPHKDYIQKNKALLDIIKRIKEGKYLGKASDTKGRDRVYHYIETTIEGKTSTIVIKVESGKTSLHTITDGSSKKTRRK